MNHDYCHPHPPDDSLRLEAVTVCVGFADILDETLARNYPHFDNFIVVTSHCDKATHAVAKKHGARLVPTDLLGKNGRVFNKGAAINAGMGHFQYHGWRLHLDADIFVPDNFRRVLFNHSHLDKNCLYGCDRIDVCGRRELREVTAAGPQVHHGVFCNPRHHRPVGVRYVDTLHGYVPLGFFQLWHASCQKPYPYSLGTAAHDDILFAALWPAANRRHLPTAFVYHLISEPSFLGQNWEGRRSKPLK